MNISLNESELTTIIDIAKEEVKELKTLDTAYLSESINELEDIIVNCKKVLNTHFSYMKAMDILFNIKIT